jgi:hypothetical protein
MSWRGNMIRAGILSNGRDVDILNGDVFGNNLVGRQGSVYYVDPTNGSDEYNGLRPDRALATISEAYSKCISGAGDLIVVFAAGTTAAGTTSYLSAVLDWTKHGITVIGMGAPTRMGQRSRIANASTATSLAYLIDVQGNNNSFYNLHLFNGGSNAAAIGGLKVSGDRNYFESLHVVGAGHATPSALVGSRSLELIGSENTFVECTFGTDTVNRVGDVANCEILLNGTGSNGARNRFIKCETLAQVTTTNTAHGAVKGEGGDCITRTIVFDDCLFHAYREGVVAIAASWFIGTAPNNGLLIVKDCVIVGYAAWDAATGNDRVYVACGAAEATTGGKAVIAS